MYGFYRGGYQERAVYDYVSEYQERVQPPYPSTCRTACKSEQTGSSSVGHLHGFYVHLALFGLRIRGLDSADVHGNWFAGSLLTFGILLGQCGAGIGGLRACILLESIARCGQVVHLFPDANRPFGNIRCIGAVRSWLLAQTLMGKE